MLNKGLIVAGLVAASAALGGVATTAQAADRALIQLPTGGVTGTYYLIAAPLANYINTHSDRLNVTPSTSGGGYENIRRVNSAEAQIGMATVDAMYEAWYGQKPFTEQMREWRTIGVVVPPMANHVVALAESGIKTADDLKGKRFAIGAPGSSAATGMNRFLQTTGLISELDWQMLPHQDYPDMLVDRRIDVISRQGTMPLSVVEELAASNKIRLIDLSGALDNSDFLKEYPFYQRIKIAAGTYPQQDYDVTVFGTSGFLIAHKDVPDDVVYEFTKLTYSDGAINTVGMAFKSHGLNPKDPLAGNGAPVHPGAARYWKEQGIEIPEPTLK
ncbi:TAXI family TRAP transporter solute-binding subunit [Oceanibacterium hippocampi]|uniref:NMT1/THI5 like protein n=1 Tax=Oceanibacterium hippocampi TaxID=745714 RepID=A0A1Y5SNZ1_9PROT|nr:TAXI family TRAP transporter solute-binding subunit [Oceanibacterium hippocampi]SLN41973.1 hypothetical protein OCH7691_01771 [Oceanibacterium hippocampi]